MPRIPIDDLDDERIAVYREVKRSNLTRFSQRFIAEGRFVVRRLVESEFAIDSLLLSEHAEPAVREWLPDDVPAYVLPKHLVMELVGFGFHQGLMACGVRKPQPQLFDLLGDTPRTTFVAMPHTSDQENLGKVIRSATAFGVDGVLLGPGCADPFSRRVLRVSMGTAFQIPIVESADLIDDIRNLQKTANLQTVAAVLGEDSQPLETLTRADRMCLLLGNEAHGLAREWLDVTDVKATVPMQCGVDSLNVAVAAGIFLYHFTRVAASSQSVTTASGASA